MKNDKNKKIFLSILVVAILIVAIVGATFAFFSASGGSANNAITANATTLANLGFTSSNSKIAMNLVPVASESEYFSRYPGTGTSGCIDDVGNEICSVYEFTVTNTASVAQTIYVSFVPSQNTFDNMYFAAFNRAAASADYTVATGSSGSGNSFTLIPQTTTGNSTLGHTATKLTKNSQAEIAMPGLTTTLSAGESVTYTILVWLQDIGIAQNQEQGGIFKAGVNVTTGGNSTDVTGVMGGGSSTIYTSNLYDENATGWNSVWQGQPISNSITAYNTPEAAITALETAYSNANSGATTSLPFFLKHTVSNGTLWCLTEYESGVATGYSYCIHSTQAECNANISNWEDDNYTYTCEENAFTDGVSESYVGFVVTPAMATANPGMVAGTYYLRGGDNGAAFLTNAKTIYDAFGGINCYGDNNLPATYDANYNPNPSSSFGCDVSGLNAIAYSYGYVYAAGNAGSACGVYEYGNSNCGVYAVGG